MPMLPSMGMPPMPPMMAGQGQPGMGPSPMGMPNPAALKALDTLAQGAPGSGEKDALLEAQGAIQAAMAKVMFRSPKAAKMLADALGKLNSALMTLEQEAEQPVMPPPDFLGAMNPAGMGTPPLNPTVGGGPY